VPLYRLYGLTVRTDAALPGLAPAPDEGGAPSMELRLGTLTPGARALSHAPQWHAHEHTTDAGEPVLVIRRGADGWLHLRYADGVTLVVDASAAEVWAAWPPEVHLADVTTYLTGPLMGLALRMRGVTCLHASAVAVDGGAVVLCGPSGAGKSTTAAALAGRGLAVLTDDVAPLLPAAGGPPLVPPGCPQLRLWGDSAAALFGTEDALPLLTPNWEKRWLDPAAAGAFAAAPLPVRAVYLLGGREESARAPYAAAHERGRAVVELAAETYMGWLPDRAARGRDLVRLGSLATTVPVRRLVPHADPARLDDLLDVLLRDVQGG
jgi:hypothetical protein